TRQEKQSDPVLVWTGRRRRSVRGGEYAGRSWFPSKVCPRSQSGEQVEVSTPAGELRVNTAAEKDVGLPVYPGARPDKSGKSVEIALPTEDQVGIATAHYRTSDPFEKVDAWYRAHLGPGFERETSASKRGKVRGKGLELSTDTTAFISEKGDLVRAVALAREGDGVDITLVRAGPSEAQ